jgi:hypothetical protein
LLYELTVKWDGKKYLGLTLAWDYIARTCDVSIPGYVQNVLQRFAHPDPDRPQHSPSPWKTVTYGAKIQYADLPDDSTPLTPPEVTRLQEVISTLLFYARAVNSTMLVALGTIATSQTKGTEATAEASTHFLNYCATHPDATIRFHKSDTILQLDSDASYLSKPRAQSRKAGYHYLSTHPDRLKPTKHHPSMVPYSSPPPL